MPLFTYRTGPFANSGIPIANGMHDYLNMLNERDGGIGGVKLTIEECETGYENEKGVECYERHEGQESGRDHAVLDRHHACGHPESGGRQHPDSVDGLWPVGFGGRQGLPLDLQSAGHLLGRRCR